MRVVVLAVGSRGDVQPYVALGLGLQRAGYHVVVATHAPFRELVTERGLQFRPVGGNPREIIESEAGQAWLRSGRNPIEFYRAFVRLARPLMQHGLADTWVVCRDADAIVYSALGWGAYSVAERLGVCRDGR